MAHHTALFQSSRDFLVGMPCHRWMCLSSLLVLPKCLTWPFALMWDTGCIVRPVILELPMVGLFRCARPI